MLVIRIPKSWNGPHRVEADNKKQFWIRDSKGAHEATVAELRNLFTLSTETVERIKAFRLERLAMAEEGEGPILLDTSARMILHLCPLAAFGQTQSIDIHRAYEIDNIASSRSTPIFAPLGWSGTRPSYNLDGMINLGGSDGSGYTQIFRSGILESVTSGILGDSREGFLRYAHVDALISTICTYLDGLRILDVPSPLVVMLSYQGIRGAALIRQRFASQPDPASWGRFQRNDPIILPEVIIDEYGSHQDYRLAVRLIFDALWNAAGYPRCDLYDEEGAYKGVA